VQTRQGESMRGLERNVSRPAPAGRAARAHQAVADEEPNRARRRRGGDEVIDRVGKKRHLVAAVLQQLVRIAIAPVFVERGPEPQVLDADAASIEKVGETAGLRQPGPAPRTRRSRLFSARRPSGENPGTRRAESKTRPAIPLCMSRTNVVKTRVSSPARSANDRISCRCTSRLPSAHATLCSQFVPQQRSD
jgi:hypothetical protein